MSKIDQIQPGATVQPGSKTSQAGKGQGPSFEDALDKATSKLDSPSAPAQPQAPQASQSVQSSQPVQAPDQAGLSPAQSQGVEMTERALDLLERYGELLGRGDVTLKDIAGTVADLEKTAQSLDEAAEGLEPGDELGELMRQVSSQATVAASKFNRGDYLPV